MIERLDSPTEAQLAELADVLVDCVAGGASVNFLSPFPLERALAWWRNVVADVGRGHRVLLAASDRHGICGTVQLLLDTPENQPHRAELSKMLVHRRARRQGVGGELLRAAEREAARLGRSLLVLDTASADAERLYARNGWVRAGVIPKYALLPQGGFCDTVLFYRAL